MSFTWSKEDDLVVKYARALAADAVQKVGNGHPGTAMSLAPVAYLLFQKHMVHDPKDPKWIGRDRFVLSCGHSSLTLYTQLFLSGYGLEMKDLESFRTWNSLTPGHPEFGHTAGVEMTTGPLGAGISTAVGMAMAARFEKGLLDRNSSLFDHNVYVICSDGDLQEGVSAEASSLAGTQELGNLIVIYDDNRISIEGDTHVAFTENVSARYAAYGWHVEEVAASDDGSVDIKALDAAIERAKKETTKPSLIRLHTVIAWPAPKAQGTSKSHGSALGDEEIAATKNALGLNPDEKFAMPADLLAHARKVVERGAKAHADWNVELEKWKAVNTEKAALLDRLLAGKLPALSIPEFPADKDIATRAASGKVINALAEQLPELWGGSADLAESNNTTIENGGSFLPATSKMKNADPYGRIIHFGIREHAMGSILNGITLSGLTKAFGGTFLMFADYMRASVRLAALMDIPTTFVWTHDSIGVGEDGPTHQPVEHFAALRAIPNFNVIRPADANETAACWLEILKRNKPAGILLSRQNLPVMPLNTSGVSKGAYAVKAVANPKVSIIATGSEVSVALKAAEKLEADGISTQVVSAPCLEWLAEQDAAYRESLLPKNALKVSIEAGIAQGWREYVGDNGVIISLDHFGASASAAKLFEEFGFGPDAIVAKIKKAL
ncbi:MAG: transketolase [Actinomycetales bacterium]|nr:transketolase [Actinomycetales bacterium]